MLISAFCKTESCIKSREKPQAGGTQDGVYHSFEAVTAHSVFSFEMRYRVSIHAPAWGATCYDLIN